MAINRLPVVLCLLFSFQLVKEIYSANDNDLPFCKDSDKTSDEKISVIRNYCGYPCPVPGQFGDDRTCFSFSRYCDEDADSNSRRRRAAGQQVQDTGSDAKDHNCPGDWSGITIHHIANPVTYISFDGYDNFTAEGVFKDSYGEDVNVDEKLDDEVRRCIFVDFPDFGDIPENTTGVEYITFDGYIDPAGKEKVHYCIKKDIIFSKE